MLFGLLSSWEKGGRWKNTALFWSSHRPAAEWKRRRENYYYPDMQISIWQCFGSIVGFPSGTSFKEPDWQTKRVKRCEFSPWDGKIPWRRVWQPTPVFLSENPKDRGAWRGTIHGSQSQTRPGGWVHTRGSTVEFRGRWVPPVLFQLTQQLPHLCSPVLFTSFTDYTCKIINMWIYLHIPY